MILYVIGVCPSAKTQREKLPTSVANHDIEPDEITKNEYIIAILPVDRALQKVRHLR